MKNIITLFGVHKKFPPDPPPLNEAYRLTIADFGASTSRDMRYGYKKAYDGDAGALSPSYAQNFLTTQPFCYFYCARSLTIVGNPFFMMIEYSDANINYPEPYTTWICLPDLNYFAFKCIPTPNALASSKTAVDSRVHDYFGQNIGKTIAIWMVCTPTSKGAPKWWPY